jgi:hypothetical protein
MRFLLVTASLASLAIATLSGQARASDGSLAPASPRPHAYAVVIGSNTGGAGQAPLRFAEDDAQRVAAVLRDLGHYAASDVHVLLHPDASHVGGAIDELATKVRANAASGEQSEVVFYYSGHARASGLRGEGHGDLASHPHARLGALAAGALALAAAILLGLGGTWRHGSAVDAGSGAQVKGDAVAFSLVCDDDERIDDVRGVFKGGDRFKAVVTCPPSLGATFDLVVYDKAGPSFPLARVRVAFGNNVPLPGAFRLSGSGDETVCLTWGRERELLQAGPPADALCKRLTASQPSP